MDNRKKLIIDTDCGSDDAMAIVMALNDPDCEILLITTVSGNVPMPQATANTLTAIEHAGTYEPPVYMGCEKMLLRDLVCAYNVHGADGMGDIGLVPERLKPSGGDGVFKMLETLRNHDDKEIDIVTLGPLTNLALAIRLDPGTVKKARSVTIMGSAGLGAGNITPVAEFNIWQDAEAARIVVEAGLDNICMVGWDACLGDCILSREEIEIIRSSGPVGQFAVDCNRKLMELNISRFGRPCLDMADPSAMAAALCPECVETREKYYCEVDASAGPGYGNVLIDRDRLLGKEPNLYICSKLYAGKYKDYIYRTLRVR